MCIPFPGRDLLALAAALAILAPASTSQLCPDPSDDFWKNDALADAPVGQPPEAQVLVAICNGEAVGTYFQMPPGSTPRFIKQVSIGFGHVTGDPSFTAILDIEIYEGSVGFNPGGPVSMGTKIFDLQDDAGQTMTVMSTGVSSFDLSPYNVVVSDDHVVAFRMLQNVSFPGCPPAIPGSAANFLTDGSGCSPGVNLLDELFTGWVDPADWEFQPGSPICPQFYSGNWVIRACTEDAGIWTDLRDGLAGATGTPDLEGSGPLTAGSLNPLALTNTLPFSSTFLVIGLSGLFAPFKGGVLVPNPDFIVGGIPTDGSGGWTLADEWPAGVPSGFVSFWQVWIPDAAGPVGFAASNGISATAP